MVWVARKFNMGTAFLRIGLGAGEPEANSPLILRAAREAQADGANLSVAPAPARLEMGWQLSGAEAGISSQLLPDRRFCSGAYGAGAPTFANMCNLPTCSH